MAIMLLTRPICHRVVTLCAGVSIALSSVTWAAAAAPGPATSALPVSGLPENGSAQPAGTAPLPTKLTAKSFVVTDLSTGAVLAVRNAHAPHAPASTLKVLTALTLLPALDPKDTVVAARRDVEVEGSKVGLVDKGRYTVDELFLSLLLSSGNDAANVLATAAGGHSATVARMNAQAQQLQAVDTVVRNPSGLDAAGQVSTAYDLALIARAALDRPDFRRYTATKKATVGAHKQEVFEVGNKNRLLYRYKGAIGGKTGYTDKARASFVGAATRDGRTLVVTLMRADPDVWSEAAALLDWGFRTEPSVQPLAVLLDPAPPLSATLPGGPLDGRASEQLAPSGRTGAAPAGAAPAAPTVAAASRPVAVPLEMSLLAGAVLGVLLTGVLWRRRQVSARG